MTIFALVYDNWRYRSHRLFTWSPISSEIKIQCPAPSQNLNTQHNYNYQRNTTIKTDVHYTDVHCSAIRRDVHDVFATFHRRAGRGKSSSGPALLGMQRRYRVYRASNVITNVGPLKGISSHWWFANYWHWLKNSFFSEDRINYHLICPDSLQSLLYAFYMQFIV